MENARVEVVKKIEEVLFPGNALQRQGLPWKPFVNKLMTCLLAFWFMGKIVFCFFFFTTSKVQIFDVEDCIYYTTTFSKFKHMHTCSVWAVWAMSIDLFLSHWLILVQIVENSSNTNMDLLYICVHLNIPFHLSLKPYPRKLLRLDSSMSRIYIL